jgi:hypothetical protein
MVCDPYICIKGQRAGEIEWEEVCIPSLGNGLDKPTPYPIAYREGGEWIPYADFEREKLMELGGAISLDLVAGFVFSREGLQVTNSIYTFGYPYRDYKSDSESSRLLKRAEFLREVCRRENVEWLPKEKCSTWCSPKCLVYPCPCSCHKPHDADEEKEWRKALLDFISRNAAFVNSHVSDVVDGINDLRSRFL